MLKINEIVTAGIFLLLICLLGKSASADDYLDYPMEIPYGPMGQMDMSGPMGTGPMYMMGRGMGFGALSMLDLSTDQKNKINKLQDELRKKHWKIMGDIMDLQSRLRDAYDADKPDPKLIGETYDKVSQLRRKMLESRVETMNEVQDLLTSEQRENYKSAHRQFGWGGGPMMRHRWRGNINN